MLLAAAALAAVSGSAAWGDTVYWDVNGSANADSGVTNIAYDWVNGTTSSSASWGDGVNSYWNTDPTGGAAGTLRGDIGAGNIGVFSAGTDANKTYAVVLPDGVNVSAGGFTVSQGNVIMPGNGNSGQGGPFGGTAPSIVNIGSDPFNINVPTGTSLTFGYRLRLATFAGSAVINKTGDGFFNNVADEAPNRVGAIFTGKWNVSGGTMGLFFGGNTMLGSATTATLLNGGANTYVPDQLTVSNNAVIKTFQQSTAIGINGNEGITIGSGGATFFFAGAKELDPAIVYASLGSVQMFSRITGGSEGARVPITIMSNTLPGNNGIGQSTGTTMFSFVDNSVSTTAPPLYAKWIIKSGEVGPVVAGTDLGLGAVPLTPLADAITLDGGYLRPNAAMTIPVNRGITLGAAGGGLHPVNATTFTIASAITGPGQLRVLVENNANGKVILTGANNYTGGTIIGGVGTNAPLGTLQGTTTSLQGAIQNGSKLIFDQTTTGSYAGTISGTGTMTKNNTGVVYFTGTNTYTGTTTVNGGVLVANSTNSLPGYNTAGKVIVNSGGAIGASAGGAGQWTSAQIDTLIGTTTLNNGSSVAFHVDPSNSFTYSTNIAPVNTVGVIKLGGGTLTLDGTNTYTGPTVVTGGNLVMGKSLRSSSALNVADGAKATLAPRSSGGKKTLQVGTLNLNASGTLDLNDNDLVVDGGGFTTVKAAVLAGFGSSGPGITSSTSDGSQILALFDNALIGAGDWNGGTIGANAVVGKYTYFGDVNFDGQVTGDDYTIIDSNLNTTPPVGFEWLSGDANLDGIVTGDDYTTIDSNLNLGTGNPLTMSALAVPEPGVLSVCLAAVPLLVRRRRRGSCGA